MEARRPARDANRRSARRACNHGGLFLIAVTSRLVHYGWSCVKWGLVLCLVGVSVAVPYLYRRVDQQVRAQVEARLAAYYPDLKVTVRSAEIVEGKGIELRGVSVIERGADGPCAELMAIEELVLCCDTDLQQLLAGEPCVSRVVMRRPTFRVVRRAQDDFGAVRLLPTSLPQGEAPELQIEDGAIEIFDPLRRPASTLTLRALNAVLVPAAGPEVVGPAAHTRRFQGTVTGDHLRQVVFSGTLDIVRQSWTVEGTIDKLDISPELRAALPGPLAESLLPLRGFRAQGDLRFQVAYDPARTAPYQYRLWGRIAQGRIDDAGLPHPLSDMRAEVALDNNGVVIDGLFARSSQATIRMSCRRMGFEPESPMWLSAEIRRLELDRPLCDCLPGWLQEQWQMLRPSGLIDADLTLQWDGHAWYPECSVRCLDVSFTHEQFPYRLEHGEGVVSLKHGRLKANLQALSNAQPVRIAAEFDNLDGQATGWLELRAEDLPIDQKLIAALPEDARAVVAALKLRGSISAYLRLHRAAGHEAWHQHLLAVLSRCAINFEHFPYPVREVRGTLEMDDDQWWFRGLEGVNDTARITGEGRLGPGSAGRELVFRLSGDDVPLDEELRAALPRAHQQLWQSFHPRGRCDLVADVRYLAETGRMELSVRADPQPETTSIEPVYFPYRLERLEGEFVYHDGRITFRKLKGRHGAVHVRADGWCRFEPDGGWQVCFEQLSADRLQLDRDLIVALPEQLKHPLLDLNPRGPVNLSGSFAILGDPWPGAPWRWQWNVKLDMHQGAIDCGVPLEHIFGSLTLTGGFDGERFHAIGELDIDSCVCRELQLTQLRGPIWIDNQRVLLGSWVARRNGKLPDANAQPPRPVTATLFGGRAQGDGWIMLGPEPRYAFQTRLSNGRLSNFAREMLAGRQDLRGSIAAVATVRGSGRSLNATTGHGHVHLREADVYELPVMVALLKILSIRRPDRNAFSKADIDFRIEGEHIYFDQIDFSGDAVSLLGKGEMDLQHNIQLAFHAIVGRGELNVPVVSQLFNGASQQIMMIRVSGTLQEPEMRRDPFPGVSQAVQALQERKGPPSAHQNRTAAQSRRLVPR